MNNFIKKYSTHIRLTSCFSGLGLLYVGHKTNNYTKKIILESRQLIETNGHIDHEAIQEHNKLMNDLSENNARSLAIRYAAGFFMGFIIII